MQMNEKVLITGSNGFIGSHIVQGLVDAGYEVVGCGRKESPSQNIGYFRVDWAERTIDTGERFDYIVHAAARSPSEEALWGQYYEDNVKGMEHLIAFAKGAGAKKIFYLSAVSAYGRVDGELKEVSPHNDISDYGLSKYIAEKLLEDSGVRYEIFTLPGVVGKNCRDPYIMRLAEKIYNGEDVSCYNSEGLFNNVLFVDDLVSFLIRRLRQGKNDEGERFLLGCTESIKLWELVERLRNEWKSRSQITYNSDASGAFLLNVNHAVEAGFRSHSMNAIIEAVINEVVSRHEYRASKA